MEDKLVDHGSRIGRIEADLDRVTETLETIVKVSAATSADVNNLTKQMGNLFSRTNRPMDWGAMIAAIALLAMASGLLIAPIKSDISNIHISERAVDIKLNSILSTRFTPEDARILKYELISEHSKTEAEFQTRLYRNEKLLIDTLSSIRYLEGSHNPHKLGHDNASN